jgi:hypothetical protein
MLLRSSEEDESLREPESQIEELSWTYEGRSQHRLYNVSAVISVFTSTLFTIPPVYTI